jgi:hypothetical protein
MVIHAGKAVSEAQRSALKERYADAKSGV